MARRASLQMISDEQISSPLEHYEQTSKDSCLPNILVMYKDSKDYEKADDFLISRFKLIILVKNLLMIHASQFI